MEDLVHTALMKAKVSLATAMKRLHDGDVVEPAYHDPVHTALVKAKVSPTTAMKRLHDGDVVEPADRLMAPRTVRITLADMRRCNCIGEKMKLGRACLTKCVCEVMPDRFSHFRIVDVVLLQLIAQATREDTR